MNCPEFRELLAERVAGEVAIEQTQAMDAHEQSCPSCRRAIAEWREMQSLLLSTWPAEDPRVPLYLSNPPRQSTRLEQVRAWFGIASMALVTGCLLMLAVLRPAVTFDRSQLSINFGHNQTEPVSAHAATQAQIQAWVRQALEQPVSQGADKMQPASGSHVLSSSEEQSRRLVQLGVEFEILKENQAAIWQQLEQHGLYLQSAWREPSDPNQKRNYNQ